MNLKVQPRLLAASLMLAGGPALAEHVTYSGTFDGSENQLAAFPVTYPCEGREAELAYREIGSLQVSSTALYDIVDAGQEVAVDVVIRVYDGSFNPDSISGNLVASSVDVANQLPLSAGKSYKIVIQQACEDTAGTYGVAVSGPGEITGSGFVVSPDYWLGEFTNDDPTAEFSWEETYYDLHGPVQFEKSGTYYFADLSEPRRADLGLVVYDGPFNPADVEANSIAILDDAGTIDLEAGKDYYFVTFSWFGDPGEWHFALFPPGTPQFNGLFSGSWNSPDGPDEINKQGIMMEVMPEINFVFFVWFTFDQSLPVATLQSDGGSKIEALGGASQRWFSGYETYETGSSSVEIKFENTTGGVFMQNAPTLEQDTEYGTGTLHLIDCNNILLEYDIPSAGAQGSYPLSRVYPDAFTVAACELLGNQPGVIE